MKIMIERLGSLLESYMVVAFLMGIMFYIMWAVDNMMGGSGGMGSQMFYLNVFLLTPLFLIVFIAAANSMQPKRPFPDYSTYRIAGVSAGVSALVFALLSLFGVLNIAGRFGVAVLFCSMFPAIHYSRLAREKESVEKGIAAFLRDYTEARKAGLSTEKIISVLAGYNYGRFSKYLKRINWLIETGVPAREAIQVFMKSTKSWLSKVYMYLLVETIDVGGATAAASEALASFATATESIEKERRMSTKMLLFIPYIMTGMYLVVVSMLMRMLAGSIPFPAANASTMNVLLLFSVVFNSLCSGLVTGKIAEETVAAGFKHVFIMTLLSLILSLFLGLL
jgi:flagellar protein FlaJ